jgi:phosphatidylglycerol:prolipoprotein diacylglycerol transferase
MGMFWRFPKLKDGTWVWTYVVGYSLIRIPYEILRVSAVAYLPGTSIKAAYVASGLGLVIGIGMLIYMYRLRFDPDLETTSSVVIGTSGISARSSPRTFCSGLGLSNRDIAAPTCWIVSPSPCPTFPARLPLTSLLAQRELLMRQLFCRLEGRDSGQ